MARIDATHEALQLQFIKQPPIEAQKIIDFVQRRRGARLAGQDRLRLEAKMPGWRERAQAAKDVLRELAA